MGLGWVSSGESSLMCVNRKYSTSLQIVYHISFGKHHPCLKPQMTRDVQINASVIFHLQLWYCTVYQKDAYPRHQRCL